MFNARFALLAAVIAVLFLALAQTEARAVPVHERDVGVTTLERRQFGEGDIPIDAPVPGRRNRGDRRRAGPLDNQPRVQEQRNRGDRNRAGPLGSPAQR
ncbi:hypothetical protein H9P43_002157 [Blastocladiella emersonii ATCC 22665]|nr:hypothetical protein H9P43_002157 [Blastocladiella emersonii ATCC 22665]